MLLLSIQQLGKTIAATKNALWQKNYRKKNTPYLSPAAKKSMETYSLSNAAMQNLKDDFLQDSP